jgi:hypothetical protein
LSPLPAGPVTVEIRAPGKATEWLGPMEMVEGRETALRFPIQLNPPARLRIRLEPPTDPASRPWKVEVSREFTAVAPIPTPAVHAIANAEGVVDLPGQNPGPYVVTVRDSDGNRRSVTDFNLQSGVDHEQMINIDAYAVQGTVFHGKDPIAAEIAFGGSSGSVKIQLHADSEGKFKGTLPHRGLWPVFVHEPSLGIQYDTRIEVVEGEDIEIVVPHTEIAGKVVDPDGAPVAKADVRAMWAQGVFAVSVTDDAGTFLLRGVPSEQDVSVRAAHRRTDRQSESISIRLNDTDRIENVILRLQPNRDLAGRVTAAGVVVTGAKVTVQPSQGMSKSATTDLDGAFRVTLPESTGEISVFVAAPGRSFHAFLFPTVPARANLEIAPVGGDVEIVQPSDASSWWIAQNGVKLPLAYLIPWAYSLGALDVDPAAKVIRFPRVAPGNYSLCAIPRSTGQTSAHVEKNCASGTLSPGGTLRLALQ